MQFRIVRSTPSAIASQLPPQLAARFRTARLPDVELIFILFRMQRPIRATLAARALARVGEVETPVVAAGGDFAADASELLHARGVLVVAEREAFWTDGAAFDRIRAMIASPVKAPGVR